MRHCHLQKHQERMGTELTEVTDGGAAEDEAGLRSVAVIAI